MLLFQQVMTTQFLPVNYQSIKLANWILSNSKNISNLKLQKLLFYSYGAALAFDFDAEIGRLNFQAWKYGPVEVMAYRNFSHHEAGLIPTPGEVSNYSKELTKKLHAILTIYGGLDAMDLVRQTHLEEPWINAWGHTQKSISSDVIKNHFKMKFRTGNVTYPEVIFDSGLFEIDQIPVQKFSSIEELASSLV